MTPTFIKTLGGMRLGVDLLGHADNQKHDRADDERMELDHSQPFPFGVDIGITCPTSGKVLVCNERYGSWDLRFMKDTECGKAT